MKWGMEVKCRKLYQLPLNQSLSDIASDMGLEAQVINFIGRVSALQQHLPLDTPLSVPVLWFKDFGIKYIIYTCNYFGLVNIFCSLYSHVYP